MSSDRSKNGSCFLLCIPQIRQRTWRKKREKSFETWIIEQNEKSSGHLPRFVMYHQRHLWRSNFYSGTWCHLIRYLERCCHCHSILLVYFSVFHWLIQSVLSNVEVRCANGRAYSEGIRVHHVDDVHETVAPLSKWPKIGIRERSLLYHHHPDWDWSRLSVILRWHLHRTRYLFVNDCDRHVSVVAAMISFLMMAAHWSIDWILRCCSATVVLNS